MPAIDNNSASADDDDSDTDSDYEIHDENDRIHITQKSVLSDLIEQQLQNTYEELRKSASYYELKTLRDMISSTSETVCNAECQFCSEGFTDHNLRCLQILEECLIIRSSLKPSAKRANESMGDDSFGKQSTKRPRGRPKAPTRDQPDANPAGAHITVAKRKERVPWSAEEDAALLAGHKKYRGLTSSFWQAILDDDEYSATLEGRDNVNLKDRYRTICTRNKISVTADSNL